MKRLSLFVDWSASKAAIKMYPPDGNVGSDEPRPGSPFLKIRRRGRKSVAKAAAASPVPTPSGEPAEGGRGGSTGSSSKPDVASPPSLWMENYRQIMERAGPPVILVDGQGEMIHLSTAAGRFLAFSTGELTRDLLQAVHPALQAPLSAVLERARVSQRPEAALSSSVHLHGEPQTVFFRVSPLEDTLPG